MLSSTHLSSAERACAYRQDICTAGGEGMLFGFSVCEQGVVSHKVPR
jgi:hypothetical protein